MRLHAEITAQGYPGSVHLVRRFVATLAAQKRHAARATVRYETGPGEQAQVDWKHVGRFADASGRPVTISAFVMVLAFSRAVFARFVTSMQLPVLIECHLAAFEFFGRLAAAILYDNMKQVRLLPGQWNPAFVDFAAHCGFQPNAPAVLATDQGQGRARDPLPRRQLPQGPRVRRSRGLERPRPALVPAHGQHAGARDDRPRARRLAGGRAAETRAALLVAALRAARRAHRRRRSAGCVSRQPLLGCRRSTSAKKSRCSPKLAASSSARAKSSSPNTRRRPSRRAASSRESTCKRTVRKAAAERHDPPPRCAVRFEQTVEQRSLSVYAEVAG